MNVTWKGVVAGAVGMLVLLIAFALLVILTGLYNVSASKGHAPIVAWALHTTFDHSVHRHAADIKPPASYTPAMIAAGASFYKASCAECHGGVGQKRNKWAEHMVPRPPDLVHSITDLKHADVFWLVKNGAKMTGMPSFGPALDDKQIWDIAAFAKALPTMSASQYASYSAKSERGK